MAEMKLVIHQLVQAEAGPIRSRQGGTSFPIGSDSRWAFACDPSLTQDATHRGTTEPYLVECRACIATQAFKDGWRPHPSRPDDPRPE